MGRVDSRCGSGRVGSVPFGAVGPRGSYNLRIIMVNIVIHAYRHDRLKCHFPYTHIHHVCVCTYRAHFGVAAFYLIRRIFTTFREYSAESVCKFICTYVCNMLFKVYANPIRLSRRVVAEMKNVKVTKSTVSSESDGECRQRLSRLAVTYSEVCVPPVLTLLHLIAAALKERCK